MTENICRWELDRSANSFVMRQVTQSFVVKRIINNAAIDRGICWTLAPNNINRDVLYNFESGGLLSVNIGNSIHRTRSIVRVASLVNILCDLLYKYIENGNGISQCFIEHPMLRADEGNSFEKSISLYFNSYVGFILNSENSKDELRAAMQSALMPWHGIGFLCLNKPFHSKDDFRDAWIAGSNTILPNIVFSIAYDGEGFVILELN